MEHVWEYALEHRQFFPTDKALYEHLIEQFPTEHIAYATLTRHLRRELWSEEAREGRKKFGPERDKQLAADIQTLLAAEPKLSANQIASRLGRAPSTVRWYLHNVLGLSFKKTRWVPHILTEKQRYDRVAASRELLSVLDEASRDDFKFLVTGDESWFFYETPTCGLWLPEDSRSPEGQKATHHAPKTMIVVFWNLHGPLVIEAVPCGESATGEYFRDTIIAKICASDLFKEARRAKKKFWIHMDNAPIHRAATVTQEMKRRGIHCAPHPPYSPDLAPSDFYLFGALKSRIRGIEFEDSEAIKEWIADEFQRIPPDELRRVFHLWTLRLQACGMLEGHYVE